jgi:flagellar motor switch protein FliG
MLNREIDGPRKVVAILNRFPAPLRKSLLGTISDEQRSLLIANLLKDHQAATQMPATIAKQITAKHSFADLIHADDNEVQYLLREINLNALCIALVDATQCLRLRFYQNMSNQAAQVLAEDIDFFSGITGRELIKSTQQEIFEQAQLNIIQGFFDISPNVTLNEPDGLEDAMHQLHIACENTMAWIISGCSAELAAAVLSQRLDRHRILARILQLEQAQNISQPSHNPVNQIAAILICLPAKVRQPLLSHLQELNTNITQELSIALSAAYHPPPTTHTQTPKITTAEIDKVMVQLQLECEKSITRVIADCSDDIAASILIQRQDRSIILQHLLQAHHLGTEVLPLTGQEINHLLNAIGHSDSDATAT